jgi:hypothetical protein
VRLGSKPFLGIHKSKIASSEGRKKSKKSPIKKKKKKKKKNLKPFFLSKEVDILVDGVGAVVIPVYRQSRKNNSE